MMKALFFLSLMLMSGLAKATGVPSTALSQKKEILRVCSDAGFFPFEIRTSTGEWEGFDVEMMERYAKARGMDLQMIQVGFDGIIPALISGKCDIVASAMSITEERKKSVLFSDPVYIGGMSIGFKKNSNKKYTGHVASFDEEKVRVAVKTGYTSDLLLTKTLQKATLLRFDQDADLLLAVLQGRADVFVSDTVYVKAVGTHIAGRLETFPLLDYEKEKIAIAFRKDSGELVRSFNEFLKEWKKTSDYAAVKAKNLGEEDTDFDTSPPASTRVIEKKPLPKD